MSAYGVRTAESDKYAVEWVVEAFKRSGVTLNQTALPKSDLYLGMLPILNSHKCTLLDHPKLISQLCGLERRPARSGKDSVDHGRGAGQHDDLANVVAGVLVALQSQSAPIILSRESLNKIKALGGGRDRFTRSARRFG
jgi:hypothetical protein